MSVHYAKLLSAIKSSGQELEIRNKHKQFDEYDLLICEIWRLQIFSFTFNSCPIYNQFLKIIKYDKTMYLHDQGCCKENDTQLGNNTSRHNPIEKDFYLNNFHSYTCYSCALKRKICGTIPKERKNRIYHPQFWAYIY